MATSDLLSNAAETTTVDGNSIIPVASAAGQPTRNVKLSTLASVVGGLIGINDTWLRAGVVLNNTDFNTLTESRLYYVQTGNTNRPSPDWGFLCVLKAHNDMILQLFVDKVNTLIKTRIRYGGSWTEWKTISLS